MISKEQWDEYVKDTRLHGLGKCWCGKYHKSIQYVFPEWKKEEKLGK